jgi:signal transduction histidine kinase/HD-like signal output (HDOD) protein
MVSKNIFEKIKQSTHLPQLPQVMLKLVKACKNAGVDVDELTRIISADPSLTSKLLQVIGSPYVNLPKEVNSIKTAVVYLGMDTIRNIAISSSAMHFFKMSGKLSEFDMTRFWYHSYKCGVIAGKIAGEKNGFDPEEFFLAGLLHDIGQLILMQTFPKEYLTLLSGVVCQNNRAQAEMDLFGTDTPKVSAWIFGRWNLNPLTAEGVLFIDEPIDKIEEELDHIKIMYLANLLSGPDPMEKIPGLLTLTDINEIRLGQILSEAEAEVEETAKVMGIRLETRENGVDPIDDLDPADTVDPVDEIERAIGLEIEELSLFYGTLRNLLSAKTLPEILDIIQKGLEIVFDVPRVFFFLLDGEKKMLFGDCNRGDKNYKVVKRIALPMSNGKSMVVKSLKTGKIQACFQSSMDPGAPISDTRIIRLLETQGGYCIPIACGERGLGVMVLGVDSGFSGKLKRNTGLLTLFSNQAGMCIQNLSFHQQYARDLNEKRMEAYATLTDKVIHEINNPISIIKNYLETLGLKLPDKHPAQEELSVVGEEITRVTRLIEGLSRFSSPKIGGFEPIDINLLCTKILDLMKKSILMPRQIKAGITIDPGIPEIKTDPNGLKQVIINLVKNAAEAMDGGGKIDIRTRFLQGSAKILIDEKKRIPGSIEILVRDNGPGISPGIREKLFEPYTSTKTGKNSGLGLSIVHSIVKELGGRITCDSKKGQGTCFFVHLPIIPGGIN